MSAKSLALGDELHAHLLAHSTPLIRTRTRRDGSLARAAPPRLLERPEVRIFTVEDRQLGTLQ